MKTKEYEHYKIKREIQIHGDEYTVCRDEKDHRGESTGKENNIGSVCGLFHIVKGYVTDKISDGVHVHSKGQPMLLCLKENATEVQNGDVIEVGERRYKVIEKNDIESYGIVVDISLEVILDG